MAGGDLFNRRRMLTQNVRPPRPTGAQPTQPSYNIPSLRGLGVSPEYQPGVDMSQMRPSRNRQTPQQMYGSQSRARAGGNAAASMLMPFSPAGAIGTGSAWGEATTRSPESYAIRGMITQSQADNPMRFPMHPDQVTNAAMDANTAEARANVAWSLATPGIPGSSIENAQRAGGRAPGGYDGNSGGMSTYNSFQAGLSNGYNGNIAYANDPNRYNPMDERSQAIQRRNAADQTAGRPVGQGSRFTGNNPMAQNTTEYARGLQGVAAGEGVMIQPGGRGSNSQYLPFKSSPQEAEAVAMAERLDKTGEVRRKYDDPRLKAKQREFAAKKLADEQAFMAANGGMNYAQARRANKRADRQDAIFQRRVKSGMNPMSPSAFAAFPEAAGRFRDAYAQRGGKQEQNPMRIASDTFRPGGNVTPDSRQRSQDFLKTLGTGGTDSTGNPTPPSPFFSGLAGSEDNIQGLHFGIQEQVQQGLEPSDDDLQKLHAATVAMQSGYKTDAYDPFDMTHGAEAEGMFGSVDVAHNEAFKPMYEELASMESPTPGKLKEWWTRFKGRVRPDTNRFIGGSSILSGEGAPVVSPGGYEYPLQAPANPMRGR